MSTVLEETKKIIDGSIKAVLPDEAVKKALQNKSFPGRVFLVAIGKASWKMAETAAECLGDSLVKGVVITKYGHSGGALNKLQIFEAGHPVPDENSFSATRAALDLVKGLTPEDTVVFLVSGGGSALFEAPLVSGKELTDITQQLLNCGADIVEINTIRKRLSSVKGGRFAKACSPAKVYAIILSDVLGDPVDMIASGPACVDSSTSAQAIEIVSKYKLWLSSEAAELLRAEPVKELDNVETVITGSVRNFCAAAEKICASMGYETVFLTDRLNCEAREAGTFFGNIAKSNANCGKKLAFIGGGETVVHIKGSGKGGRNQEMALSCALQIDGLDNVVFFSVGSDGTDGPTDAAGGIVDGSTAKQLREKSVNILQVLENNDSYNALKSCDGLIITGPTGTNVNDLSVVLIN